MLQTGCFGSWPDAYPVFGGTVNGVIGEWASALTLPSRIKH